ncbi:MAG: hypothetical protein ABIR70_04685 [Bryobacteraceae bacterium]
MVLAVAVGLWLTVPDILRASSLFRQRGIPAGKTLAARITNREKLFGLRVKTWVNALVYAIVVGLAAASLWMHWKEPREAYRHALASLLTSASQTADASVQTARTSRSGAGEFYLRQDRQSQPTITELETGRPDLALFSTVTRSRVSAYVERRDIGKVHITVVLIHRHLPVVWMWIEPVLGLDSLAYSMESAEVRDKPKGKIVDLATVMADVYRPR